MHTSEWKAATRQLNKMDFENQTVCSKTHSWSYERWWPSRTDESPSRTKAESELACVAKKCLLAAISAEVQLWWTSAAASGSDEMESRGSSLYSRPVRRPHPWAVEDTLYVSPGGGGGRVSGGSDMKGSGRVGFHCGVTPRKLTHHCLSKVRSLLSISL